MGSKVVSKVVSLLVAEVLKSSTAILYMQSRNSVEGEEKVDPYNNKRKYENWKKKVYSGIPDESIHNSKIIKEYIFDMEDGNNIDPSNGKGGRSYIRLNTLIGKMKFFSERFKQEFDIDDVTKITEEQLNQFFTKMRRGEIKKKSGSGGYKMIGYYVKVFKAFWHWHMKVNRKKGIDLRDITLDLDSSNNKPAWVYLEDWRVKKLWNSATFKYRALMTFLYDSGIRSPTELKNIKVSDLNKTCKTLIIRDEISKTFGRTIKLMICSEILKEWIEDQGLKGDDYIFGCISPSVANRYLKKLSKKLFGEEKTKAGGRYSELTLYDFRHNSACYWAERYPTESALKYRFGWVKSKMIFYYTELLGLRDNITEEDMLVSASKTE
jgi:integrase